MIVTFTRKIRGKEGKIDKKGKRVGVRLSISVPKEIVDAYKLHHEQDVRITLKDNPIDPEMSFEFEKKLRLAGSQGLLVYLDKKYVIKHDLKVGMTVFVKLVTLKLVEDE